MDARFHDVEFTVRVSKDDLIEFLDSHAQKNEDVFGQLPEDESIPISITMKDHYSDVEFELSYDAE